MKVRDQDDKSESEQRRDALLKQVLKTPPESREQLKEKLKAWKEQESASSKEGRREPSA